MASTGRNENSPIESGHCQFRISNDGYWRMWQGMSRRAIHSRLGHFWRKFYFHQSQPMIDKNPKIYRKVWIGFRISVRLGFIGYFSVYLSVFVYHWSQSIFKLLSIFISRIFETGFSRMEVSAKRGYHGHGVVQKRLVIESIIQRRFQFWILPIIQQLNRQCLLHFTLLRKLLKERFTKISNLPIFTQYHSNSTSPKSKFHPNPNLPQKFETCSPKMSES